MEMMRTRKTTKTAMKEKKSKKVRTAKLRPRKLPKMIRPTCPNLRQQSLRRQIRIMGR